MSKDAAILRKAKNLIKTVEELTKNAPSVEPIKVENIYLPLNHLFNAAAKKAMNRQVKTLKSSRKPEVTPWETVVDEVRYFGAVAHGERSIFDAAQKIANTINALSLAGYVTGSLLKLSVIKLVTEPHELDKYVVVSYVAITPKGLKYLDENRLPTEFKEGEIPGMSDEDNALQVSLATDADR